MIVVILLYSDAELAVFGPFASRGHGVIWADAMRRYSSLHIVKTTVTELSKPKKAFHADLANDQS